AEAGSARSAAAVRVATASALPQASLDEPAAERLGTDHQALAGELLAGEGGPEIGVAAAVGREHRAFALLGGLVVGGATTQAVDDGGIATGLEFALQASDLADRTVEQSRGLGLGAFAAEDGM